MAPKDFVRNGRNIIAIGRNYAEHAKELGNATPTEPFYFLKPTSSYVQSGSNVEIPRGCIVHHEVELAVVIGKSGRDILEKDSDKYVAGYALAIDMTARNVQDKAKSKGLPWAAAKGFDTFTPISKFIPKRNVKDPHNMSLWLSVNGVIKQKGNTSDMIFKIPQLIQHVSSIITLKEGDIILTGTPAGVGPINAGDLITAWITNEADEKPLVMLKHRAIARSGGYQFKL